MKNLCALSIKITKIINITVIFSNDLLKKDKYVCIHYRNIHSLAIELFKVKENLSNTVTDDFLPMMSWGVL